jgi:hypothetical protein
MLKVMEQQDLREPISGLFKFGTVPTIHLCSFLVSSDAIKYFMTQFVEKDKTMLNLIDS